VPVCGERRAKDSQDKERQGPSTRAQLERAKSTKARLIRSVPALLSNGRRVAGRGARVGEEEGRSSPGQGRREIGLAPRIRLTGLRGTSGRSRDGGGGGGGGGGCGDGGPRKGRGAPRD
jgi:hypothetical protein